MSPTFAALSLPTYRRYLLAQFGASTALWSQRLAQDWLVLQLSGGSGVAVGIVTALQFIPFLIVTPFAGLLADRISRRRLIVSVQAGLVILSLLMALMVWTDTVTMTWIYAFALVSGIAAATDTPARQAMLGDIVGQDRLVNAVALNSVTFNLARIGGPAIGGLLILLLGNAPVFAITAGLFAVAMWAIWSLRIPSVRRPASSSAPTLREGIAFVRSDPTIMFCLAAIGVVATFGLNFQLTTGLMSTVEFGGTAASFGVLTTFLSVGSLIGSLLAARRTAIRIRLVAGAALAFSAATALAGVMPTWWTYAVWLPLCGLTAMTFTTATQSYVQVRTPAHLRGRVMGFYTMLFFAGTPIGAPLIGWLADSFGPRFGLIGGGLLSLVGAALLAVVLVRRRRSDASARGTQTPDGTEYAHSAHSEQDAAEHPGTEAVHRGEEQDADRDPGRRRDQADDLCPSPGHESQSSTRTGA